MAIRKRIGLYRTSIGSLAFCLLLSKLYAQASPSPPEMIEASRTQNGVTVTVAVQKTAIPGEAVVMRIRVSNQGKNTILYDRDADYPRYDIVAKKDENFKYDVAKTGFGLSNFDQNPRRTRLHTSFHQLPPGESSVAVINLARCFDLSDYATIQVTVTVPYKEIVKTPFFSPGATVSRSVTAPPVVFELDAPADDSTFGRNNQHFGDPYP